MQTAEFNYEDFNSNSQSAQDETLLVKFFMKPKKDNRASLEAGRDIFKDTEYVDIKIAGNRTGGACRPATFKDKQRFPKHYAAFKNRVDAPSDGTPLGEWPLISRSMVEELAFFHVKTVEQLIDMSDTHSSKFMGIHELQAKAKSWLDKTDETAKINEIESLKSDNEAKAEQIQTLSGLIESLEARLNEVEKASTAKPAAKTAKK